MVSKKQAKRGNDLNEQMIKLENKLMLIKVELLFKGDRVLVEAIKEHLIDSIECDFIEVGKKEQVILKSLEILR